MVDTTTPGLTATRARSIDLVRQYGTVRLDAVSMRDSARVGPAVHTVEAINRQRQIAVLLRCAEIVGTLEHGFEFTLAYAFDRFSFGRLLASYQALKHRYADMFMRLQACEAVTDARGSGSPRSGFARRRIALLGQVIRGERGVEIVQDCTQIHGGIGVTWEHDLHVYLRRVTLNASTFGTPDDHAKWLADITRLEYAVARREHAPSRPRRSAQLRHRHDGGLGAGPPPATTYP